MIHFYLYKFESPSLLLQLFFIYLLYYTETTKSLSKIFLELTFLQLYSLKFLVLRFTRSSEGTVDLGERFVFGNHNFTLLRESFYFLIFLSQIVQTAIRFQCFGQILLESTSATWFLRQFSNLHYVITLYLSISLFQSLASII